MILFRGSQQIAVIKPIDTSYLTYAVMAENSLYIEFVNKIPMDIRLGDYVTAEGSSFFVSETPIPEIVNGVYKYSIKLLSTREELDKVFLFQFGSPEVIYTCSPFDFLSLVVENMNRAQPTRGWVAGSVISGDVKTLSFSNQSCLSAIQSAAGEWNTEFWTDGYAINLCTQEVRYTPAKSLAIGAGLKSIAPEKNKQTASFTRIYAYGGTRNLPANYGSSRLKMDVPYIEDSSADEIIEHVEIFDDIYPRRTGTISSARTSSGIWYFSDATIDFNPNDLQIAGLTKHVVFASGACVGLDFEVNYNSSTGEFEIINYSESNGMTLPSDSVVPAVGDTYKLYNIAMPSSYLTNAMAELKTRAQGLLDASKGDPLSLNIEIDEGYFLKNEITLALGEIVNVSHPYIPALVAGRDIRITAFKRYLNRPYKYDSVKVSDIVYSNPVTALGVATNKIENVIAKSGMSRPNYFSRNWRDVEELSHMVDTLRASMLLIGDVQGAFTLQDVYFETNAKGNPALFVCSGGTLFHKTIPTEQTPGDWVLSYMEFTLDSDTTAYYLYAKCDRLSDGATFVVSTVSIVYDSDAAYYYFLIGVISSVRSGARTFQSVYGYTQISGNEIVTGKIVSRDAKTYFDIENSEIGGNIKFLANGILKPVEVVISDAISNNNASYVDIIKSDLQSQIDGQIISWFYQVDPTLTNAPAVDWTTDALKLQHSNDTYTNTNTGACWRWQQISGVWGWGVISDTATQQALTAARIAQDTADNKRRVFYMIDPYLPYDKGDLWIDSSKTLWICISPGVESFDSGDWEIATKYTDDTAAIAAQQTANSAASAASAAQTAANTANNEIANISSDNVLSASEKPSQRLLWDTISSEKAANDAQADSFTVSRTAYDNAFQTLAKYLNAGETWASGVPSWLSDANLSVDTAIVGSTYRANWKAYYDARTNLLNAISTAAQTLANNAQTTANAKSKHFTGTATPTPPYNIGDTWTNGTDYYVCAVTRTTGSYVANDFVLATGYDNTVTTINGGIITSGTVEVAGDSNIKAGITGQDTGDTAIRMWAGDTYANRYIAPFRVQQDGSVTMTKASVTGTINATTGKIGGFNIQDGQLSGDLDPANDRFVLYPTSYIAFISGTANPNVSKWAGIGNNVLSATTGAISLARFQYSDTLGYGTQGLALITKFRPANQDPSLAQQAINNDGNVFSIGGHCLFDDTYIGTAYTDILQLYIGRTTTFVFNSVSGTGTLNVYLPTLANINAITGSRDITFELKIIMASGSTSISVTGSIFDNNLNHISSIAMSYGDTLVLRYYNGYYYIVSHMQ